MSAVIGIAAVLLVLVGLLAVFLRMDAARLARVLRLTGPVLLAVAGIAVGLAGATAVTRYLQSMLFGVTPLDRGTFLAVALAFAAVAALASYLPARRATQVDPMVTLRTE